MQDRQSRPDICPTGSMAAQAIVKYALYFWKNHERCVALLVQNL